MYQEEDGSPSPGLESNGGWTGNTGPSMGPYGAHHASVKH